MTKRKACGLAMILAGAFVLGYWSAPGAAPFDIAAMRLLFAGGALCHGRQE